MTRLTSCPDAASVADRAAAQVRTVIEQARAERGVAHVALSGGGTPERTYRLLGEDAEALRGTEVWFADERCVGPDDPESNYRMAYETLLGPAGIPSQLVHRMRGELGPAAGARSYESELRERLGGEPGEPVMLDLVLLGIGPDGHVASLFPGSATLAEEHALCLGVENSPKPPPGRITLTLPVLRAARGCLLVAVGASKSDALAATLGEPSESVPASLLRRERLTVITDDAAAPPAPNRR
ncbi:MAG TPA: 6-phosphogluconolactonase [Solirubrobacteraceae bacterium]|nr:6-phosphogluconolactonase [Solirubrobacteraceae bacterium]